MTIISKEEKYIKELELFLVFMCDCYKQSEKSIRRATAKDNFDLYFSFPKVQGFQNNSGIEKIAKLRGETTQKNEMSITEIAEILEGDKKVTLQ